MEDEETSSSSLKQVMHSSNALEHILIFLKCIVNEHDSMSLISLSRKSILSLILRLSKIERIPGISTTHTKWDTPSSCPQRWSCFTKYFLFINRAILLEDSWFEHGHDPFKICKYLHECRGHQHHQTQTPKFQDKNAKIIK
jgi:hypothetical protein